MRFEGSVLFWIAGLVLVVAVWYLSRNGLRSCARFHARALALSLGLGVAFTVGEGGLTIYPSTQLWVQGLVLERNGQTHTILGAGFWAANWLAALLVLNLWKPRTEGRHSGASASTPVA